MVLILSILAMLSSLGGNILIMFKKKSGWIVWILGNLLWILINFLGTLNVPMVIMYLVYIIINIMGFIEWKRKE